MIRLISLILTLCFITPTFAQAYDGEEYQQHQAELYIQQKFGLSLSKFQNKVSLKEHLLKALDEAEKLLKSKETPEQVSGKDELIRNFNDAKVMNKELDTKELNTLVTAIEKTKTKKLTKKSDLKKEKLIKKLQDSRTKLLVKGVKTRTIVKAFKVLAMVAVSYAVLFAIGEASAFSFFAALLSPVLGVFGVFLALFIVMGAGLAVVIGTGMILFRKA